MSFIICSFIVVTGVSLIILVILSALRGRILRRFMEAVERGDIEVAIFESERQTEPGGRRRTESVVGVAAGLHFRLSVATDAKRGIRDFRLNVDSLRFRARRVPIDDIKHPFSLMYLKLNRLLKRRGAKTG